MPHRRKPASTLWTPNQVVAFNVAKARLLRGWTQEEAAQALAPYLGTRLSTASFSAIERSVDGGRIREFSADELVAFARGFRLPIGWFFTPPSVWEGVGVATPDAGDEGLDPMELLDAVLGTPETLEDWRKYLFSWPDPRHRLRVYAEGRTEDLGPVGEDVHPRLEELIRLRARRMLRDRFGDVDSAREVLEALAALLREVDEDVLGDTGEKKATAKRAKRTHRAATARR